MERGDYGLIGSVLQGFAWKASKFARKEVSLEVTAEKTECIL